MMKKGLYITLLSLISFVGNVFSQSKTISGGNDHGLIICAQGFLYTWGNNFSSTVGGPLLGIDPSEPNANDKYVITPSRVMSNNLTFSQVTAGSGAFNLALACNSIVYAWGENTNGGCGQGPGGENVIKFPKPVLKGETSGYKEDGTPGGDYLGGVTYIAASTNSGFAIMDDGRVVGWGGGSWNGSTNKTSPVYIKDKSGKDITNVTHISGGDDNCLIRTADGRLYGIGPYNGSTATAVTYATPVLKDEDGEPLTDIRMSAAGDVCGFAVTGDGYVWSWGNGGWGGSTGIQQAGKNHDNAIRVSSGEYEKYSKEPFLTDVKEVIGGRGHGAAVTKEGYLVYWGCNDGNGGVAPVPDDVVNDYPSGDGVMPVLARYCDASGKPGPIVEDAVSVSRGDNFDFMMNDKDEYYVWGLNDLGQAGTGTSVSKYNCLIKLNTIPCKIQDNCPEVFMTDIAKCPGEEIELDCGFVVPIGKEDRYYIEWYHDGKRLNSTDMVKASNGNYKYDPSYDLEEYNAAKIKISEAGKYKVIAYYIGENIPCDKCEPAIAEIVVTEMDMPIDTLITIDNCVANPLVPSSVDDIKFEAVVNNKFYKENTTTVQFAAFSTADEADKDTLEVITTTGNGGEIKFSVSGDKIKEIDNNENKPSKDTIYHVWLEDVTQFNTQLMQKDLSSLPKVTYKAPTKEDTKAPQGENISLGGSSDQKYGQIISLSTTSVLKTFSVFAFAQQAPQWNQNWETKEWTESNRNEGKITITPVVYAAGKESNGGFTFGEEFWRGKAQSFTLYYPDGVQECIVKCDVELPVKTARGAEYILGAIIDCKTGSFYVEASEFTGVSGTVYIADKRKDSEDCGISLVGATANGYGKANAGTANQVWNITFGKKTEYDCGRIQLSARYYCPPCNTPNKLNITASETIKNNVDLKYKKVVELCKESPDLKLDIDPLVGKEPTAKFDIFWFDKYSLSPKETDALDKDVTGNATTFEFKTDWATVAKATSITEDVEKVYYVMVRDNQKPESEKCYVWDSIKVIAHPAPVDTLEWIEFCEDELTEEPTFKITDKTINWLTTPTNVKDLRGPATTGTEKYTYDYTVIDDKTGCESETHTLTISVNKTGKPDVETSIPQLKDETNKFRLSAAVNKVDDNCEVRWYDSETATSELSSLDIPLNVATTITVWAEQYNQKTGCVSERVEVEIVINDAPVPEVTNESLCLGDVIPDLSEYVTPKESSFILNWYTNATDAKGTGTTTAPSVDATVLGPGTHKFYVSQTNPETSAESEKATLTITVHEVATLDLTGNQSNYCLGETATPLTSSYNNDGEYSKAMWSKKSDMSDAVASITPTTTEKTTLTYYAQAQYDNSADAQKPYASTVCYGAIKDVDITVNKTDAPTSGTNFFVQYLLADASGNAYKPLLQQESQAVIAESGHTLNWYDENESPLTSEPAPDYIAGETTAGRTVTYYVSQTNTATGCESAKEKVTAVVSSFPSPEVTSITMCEGSDNLNSPFILQATISNKGGVNPLDCDLIWYKEDPIRNPGATPYTQIDLSQENLSYNADLETEKDFPFYVVQVDARGGTGAVSPPTKLMVTIYSNPRLKTTTPQPICKGDFVDLADQYTISNRISNQDYNLEYLSAEGDNPNGHRATLHGKYKCRAFFELSSGEVCHSKFEEILVEVNELEVAIEGDNKTCPGIGVDLKAVLTEKNMVTAGSPTYDWRVSPTGVTGAMETFNTSDAGLANKGDKITVNLEVSKGACKAKRPVDAHLVVVEEPGVEGIGAAAPTIKFDEEFNTNSGTGTYTLSKDRIVTFDGCNNTVDVLFNVKHDGQEFTYKNLTNGDEKTIDFDHEDGRFSAIPGLYEVKYNNTCAASFKFEIIDKSLDISGSPTNWSVCEGEPLTITIINSDRTKFDFDPRKYTVEWQKDGTPLTSFNTEVLHIDATTPADNGVYSYRVTSSGCVYYGYIAMGGSFTSKPKVKINEALLENNGVYEGVRTKAKTITIPFIQPTSTTTLNDKIVWKEDGVEVNKGESLTLASLDGDHEYHIVIANGERGTDSEFCGTTLDISLKADALLKMDAAIVDIDGNQTANMCINEEGVGVQIDTTGTGKVLHPDKLTFKVVEKIGTTEKTIPMVKKGDYVFASINPNASATYNIIYKYNIDNQDESTTGSITVHPAYEVEWDRNVRLCEGEMGTIQITKAEPSANISLTWEADECLINGSKTGANVEAVFSGTGLMQKKALKLIASNGGYCRDKEYYPEFIIDREISGEIIAPEFICEGHAATLDASSFRADQYEWRSPENLGSTILSGPKVSVTPKAGFAFYNVDMTRGACKLTAETTLEVRYAPKFDRIDSLSFRSIEIVLQPGTGTEPFRYIVDEIKDEHIEDAVKDSLEYGEHKIQVIDAAGCLLDSTFTINAPGLEFPIHISPNGDGKNDVFSVPVLKEAYPDAKIRIFDRWGKKLAEYRAGNSEMDWDGTYLGMAMPTTDYWYEIEIKEIKKIYTGHFTLIRQ